MTRKHEYASISSFGSHSVSHPMHVAMQCGDIVAWRRWRRAAGNPGDGPTRPVASQSLGASRFTTTGAIGVRVLKLCWGCRGHRTRVVTMGDGPCYKEQCTMTIISKMSLRPYVSTHLLGMAWAWKDVSEASNDW